MTSGATEIILSKLASKEQLDANQTMSSGICHVEDPREKMKLYGNEDDVFSPNAVSVPTNRLKL